MNFMYYENENHHIWYVNYRILKPTRECVAISIGRQNRNCVALGKKGAFKMCRGKNLLGILMGKLKENKERCFLEQTF